MRSERFIAVLLALVFLLPVGAAAQTQADWPQFQFDAARTGFNPLEKGLNKTNVSKLTKAWEYSVEYEGTWPAFFHLSPVSQGRIYVVSIPLGDAPAIAALDAVTGQALWPDVVLLFGRQVMSAPAVDNGRVYVATNYGLHALEADNGGEIWYQSCGISTLEGNYISPAVVDGVVYVGSSTGTLYAFEGASGAKLWEQKIGVNLGSSPAVAAGVVYASTWDTIYALDAATGTLKWTEAGFTQCPVVAQGRVFVAGNGNGLTARDAATGEELWRYPIPYVSPPAVAGEMVFVGGYDEIIALKAATGEEVWSTAIPAVGNFSTPTVANGVVYVISATWKSEGQTFVALDAATGRLLKQDTTPGFLFPGFESPAVVNGTVYTPGAAYKLGKLPKGGKSPGGKKAK